MLVLGNSFGIPNFYYSRFFWYGGIQIFRHMFASVCTYLLLLESLNIHCHHIFIYRLFCDKLHVLFGDCQATSETSCSYTVEVEAVSKKKNIFSFPP